MVGIWRGFPFEGHGRSRRLLGFRLRDWEEGKAGGWVGAGFGRMVERRGGGMT